MIYLNRRLFVQFIAHRVQSFIYRFLGVKIQQVNSYTRKKDEKII